MQGVNSILQHYGGSFVNALLSVYPTIGIDKNKFNILPSMTT